MDTLPIDTQAYPILRWHISCEITILYASKIYSTNIKLPTLVPFQAGITRGLHPAYNSRLGVAASSFIFKNLQLDTPAYGCYQCLRHRYIFILRWYASIIQSWRYYRADARQGLYCGTLIVVTP